MGNEMMNPHSESKDKRRLHDVHITPNIFSSARAIRLKGIALYPFYSSRFFPFILPSLAALLTKANDFISRATYYFASHIKAMLEISDKMSCERDAHHPGVPGSLWKPPRCSG
jgi:hypothetical protein